MEQKKVVILGGGFGGLNVARELGNSQFDVWLIDKRNHHLFPPLLYEVATANLSPANIAISIRQLLAPYKNITVLMGDVVSINKEERTVSLHNGEYISYDYLVIALGSESNYFGHEAWKKFAPGLKSLSDALNLRERILISFEKAERCSSITEVKEHLNFVIIGGGPTGVEMAGAIAEISYKAMLCNFRHIDPKQAKIYLVEALPRILAAFPPILSSKAQGYLKKLGVQVMTGQKATEISAHGVQIEKTFIPTQNIIWAAGDQGSSVLKSLNVSLDRNGRVIVNAHLAIPSNPEIFVIGDAACTMNKKNKPLPAFAQVAMQQGRYVGKFLRSSSKKKQQAPFSYFDKGMLATIGKTKAIGVIRKWKFSGFFAWTIWGFIHVGYLEGWRNRFSVSLQWLFSFFTNQRGARLIYGSIDEEMKKTKKIN